MIGKTMTTMLRAAAMAAVALTAAATTASAADRLTLAMPGVPPVFGAVVAYVGKDAGIFAKYDLDVTVKAMESGAAAANFAGRGGGFSGELSFQPFGYGQVNLRVANVLVGLVPIIGWPAILGQTLGVLIANLPVWDPLGPIDMVNVVPTFIFSWLTWRLRNKSVFLGLAVYSVVLGVSVSLALNYAFGLPLEVEIPYVTAGIFIATALLGYALYRAVSRLGVLQRRFNR